MASPPLDDLRARISVLEANAISLGRRVDDGFDSLRDNQEDIKRRLDQAAVERSETARKIDRWDNVLGGMLRLLAIFGAISGAIGWVVHEFLHWGTGKN